MGRLRLAKLLIIMKNMCVCSGSAHFSRVYCKNVPRKSNKVLLWQNASNQYLDLMRTFRVKKTQSLIGRGFCRIFFLHAENASNTIWHFQRLKNMLCEQTLSLNTHGREALSSTCFRATFLLQVPCYGRTIALCNSISLSACLTPHSTRRSYGTCKSVCFAFRPRPNNNNALKGTCPLFFTSQSAPIS